MKGIINKLMFSVVIGSILIGSNVQAFGDELVSEVGSRVRATGEVVSGLFSIGSRKEAGAVLGKSLKQAGSAAGAWVKFACKDIKDVYGARQYANGLSKVTKYSAYAPSWSWGKTLGVTAGAAVGVALVYVAVAYGIPSLWNKYKVAIGAAIAGPGNGNNGSNGNDGNNGDADDSDNGHEEVQPNHAGTQTDARLVNITVLQ